uniref:Putative F-box protein PP2-B12 isoform X1 n=1 Tax=Rhizophora mucronata TaxID=61149 RepID=A0A2P2M930_RHIMU
MLSPSTLYSAFLVFKLTTEAYGFNDRPAEVAMGLAGSESGAQTVYLDTVIEQRQRFPSVSRNVGYRTRLHFWRGSSHIPFRVTDVPYPKERGDGWLEIKLVEFLNEEGENEELEMTILEVKSGRWKGGLILHGIEIKPKEGK